MNSKIIGHKVHTFIFCIDAYEEPNPDEGEWLSCPFCELKPRIWVFNNGRSTACGCWTTQINHFAVHAESVLSVHKRTGGKKMAEYNSDELRVNWNHWCRTKEILFKHASERNDGRW